MRILILAVGKTQEPLYQAGIDEFMKRLSRFTDVQMQVLPPSKKDTPEEIRIDESKRLRQATANGGFVVLLDERGAMIDSPGLAEMLESQFKSGASKLTFVIGGAYGVDDSFRKEVNMVWSLSKLVFPHQMVRLLLTEQLYRAFSILNNLPYHHS